MCEAFLKLSVKEMLWKNELFGKKADKLSTAVLNFTALKNYISK